MEFWELKNDIFACELLVDTGEGLNLKRDIHITISFVRQRLSQQSNRPDHLHTIARQDTIISIAIEHLRSCALHGLAPQSQPKELWEDVGIYRTPVLTSPRARDKLALQRHGTGIYVTARLGATLPYATRTEP